MQASAFRLFVVFRNSDRGINMSNPSSSLLDRFLTGSKPTQSGSEGVEQPVNPFLPFPVEKPQVVAGLGLGFLGLLLVALAARRKKPVLAQARWANNLEKVHALQAWRKQRKEKKYKKSCIKLGRASLDGWKPYLSALLFGYFAALPIASTQSSILCLGATDFGKTETVASPAIADIIDQEQPAIVLDPKGDLTARFAPLAKERGYEVYHLAPGKPYTHRLNLLDFLEDEDDSLGGNETAETINSNASGSSGGEPHPFYGPSAHALVRSILMLAKSSKHPDLLMASQILSLDDLPKRVNYAYAEGKISPWIRDSFKQFLESAGSDKTITNIKASAALTFDNMCQRAFYDAFIGPSTIPKEFTGKRILFIEPGNYVKSTMPAIATIIDALVEYNTPSGVTNRRKDTLFVVLEEFHMGYFPKLEQWLALKRSYGVVFIMVSQAIPQIEKKYQLLGYKIINSSSGTKIYLNPRETGTEEAISRSLGMKEIRFPSTSHSTGGGRGSRNTSEVVQKVPLMASEEVGQMPKATFIIKNMELGSEERTMMPMKVTLKFPKADLEYYESYEQQWINGYQELCDRSRSYTKEEAEHILNQRAILAEFMLPLPPEEEEKGSKSKAKSKSKVKESLKGIFAEEAAELGAALK